MPPNAVYVGRPTKWGNPYDSASVFESWLLMDGRYIATGFYDDSEAFHPFVCTGAGMPVQVEVIPSIHCWSDLSEMRQGILHDLHLLRGKDLACWCPLDKHCHADVLLELANQ